MVKYKKTIKKLFWRYVKYNIVGTSVFLIAAIIYFGLFPILGEWTYIVSSVSGGIIEFSLITVLNITKRGQIFDSYKTPEELLSSNKSPILRNSSPLIKPTATSKPKARQH